MSLLPLRLPPGVDLRRSIEDRATTAGHDSGFVVAGIGSLVTARLRYAGEPTDTEVPGPLELLSLSGSFSASGAHLHASVSDATGRVHGGHLGHGSIVRTTAELLLAVLPDGSLVREHDPATGFMELLVRRGG
jgi:uncharacterized protein